MEQLIGRAKFSAKCVKNEIHNILTTLRLTRPTHGSSPQAKFHIESLKAFQQLFEELTYMHELHEFDIVAYVGPFLEVIQSDATSGELTAVALEAVDKFVSFGLVHPDSPKSMEAINMVAWGVINCRFLSNGTASDEVVLLKMVGLLLDCLRCSAGQYLSDPCVWHMVRKCFQVSRQPNASHLLRSSAEGMLQQMVLTIFGTQKERSQHVRIESSAASEAERVERAEHGSKGPSQKLQVYKPYGFRAMHFVLRFLAFLLAYGRGAMGEKEQKHRTARVRRPRSRSPSQDRTRTDGSPEEGPPDLGLTDAAAVGKEELMMDTHCLGLSLLNVALESGGDEIARSDDLIAVIQDDICKSLLHNSRTASLSVLSLTLRAIFNLFLHFKRHLKVQLEIFFTSVHLKIAGCGTASYEQRELAMESLVEFCREPSLMLELYENYDCDVRCTNLFETLAKFLVTHSVPPEEGQVRGNFTSLHKLAFSGLMSILHSLSLRCASHKHFRRDQLETLEQNGPSTPSSGETELRRKKEQKRRLTIAARTFNSEPSKSTGALQSLGLLSNPLTPESMAEFLRHTPGLDMNIVGEFLGKRHDFNGQVRKAFLDTFPFAGLGLVEALRIFLATFRLPGEAQCIERLMESFAEAYFRSQPIIADGASAAEDKPQNPLAVTRWVPRERSAEEAADRVSGQGGGPEDGAGEEPTRVPMASSDTIFILAFSIIMLNTDLHNPGVKKKMCLEEFVRNNRGIDGGKDLPQYFLRDIFEAIRDDEIRLHGAPNHAGDDQVIDDFFWEGILLRSESIDAFSTTERLLSEAPPGTTERDMFQVILDCQPMPMLTLCYESIPDAAVAMQAMMGFQDLARISAYFDNPETVSGLVRTIFQYCSRAASGGTVTVRCQIALSSSEQCVTHFAPVFREAEWRGVLEVLLQLWALDLLPPHLSEFDDFSGTDGKPLESLCNIRPLYPPPEASRTADAQSEEHRGYSAPQAPAADGDGFLESLARWFEDETKDEDDEEAESGRPQDDLLFSSAPPFPAQGQKNGAEAAAQSLPVDASDPGLVHQLVKQYMARSGFVEVLSHGGIAKLPPESLQGLAKALVQLSRPSKWFTQAQSPEEAAQGVSGEWHEVADPVFCLELLTNITCMPSPSTGSTSLSHIWPLVSTHFERLLQYVIAGNGVAEAQFIERLIVNTLRLCIRLISNSELVPTLLMLTQYLSKLPGKIFCAYSERIACGILVLVQEATLPHSGLCNIFSLLNRISEFPAGVGACSAGIECLNFWLSDDQELSRLLSLQQLPELLKTLKAFAQGSSAPAALGHLSSLVPQLARGARCLAPEANLQWRSLWVPTLQALADIAKDGSQRSSAQAFVYLQRLLLECGTDLALPWEELEFDAWKECLEQVLFPLLQAPSKGGSIAEDVAALRQANAAQLVCRVLLTHMSQWLRSSPDGFPVLFLRLLHILVSEATVETSREPLVESLKNLLLVISADPAFGELSSPRGEGETLLEAAWGVVSPSLPDLRREVAVILDPSAVEPGPSEVPEVKTEGD